MQSGNQAPEGAQVGRLQSDPGAGPHCLDQGVVGRERRKQPAAALALLEVLFQALGSGIGKPAEQKLLQLWWIGAPCCDGHEQIILSGGGEPWVRFPYIRTAARRLVGIDA